MNPTTFNDHFERGLKRISDTFQGLKPQTLLNAPLFYHEDGATMWDPSEENEYVRDEVRLLKLPFPTVRLLLKSTDGQNRYTSTTAIIVSRLEPKATKAPYPIMSIIGNVVEVIDKTQPGKKYKGGIQKELIAILRTEGTNPGKHTIMGCKLNPKTGEAQTMEQSPLQEFADYAWEILTKFAIDALSPANHIAASSPNKPERSVEWKKARTHYIILNRSHPANKVGMTGKIEHDQNKAIERIAHARRAHYRLLKSEKFRNKRGKRIFIRSTWIGPKEWEDTKGNIYIIQEPNHPDLRK